MLDENLMLNKLHLEVCGATDGLNTVINKQWDRFSFSDGLYYLDHILTITYCIKLW